MARSQRSRHHGGLSNEAVKVTTPTLSLEALHQLVQRRAEERKKTNSSNKEWSTRECLVSSEDSRKTVGTKNKRKRHNIVESCDDHMTEAQEAIKQMRLQEVRTEKEALEKKIEEKKKLKEKRKNDDDVVGNSESKRVNSSAKHTRKLKMTNSPTSTVSKAADLAPCKPASTPFLSSEESGDSDDSSADSACESIVDVEEVSKLSSVTRTNGTEAQDEDTVADLDHERSYPDDNAPGLEPLSHKQHHSHSKVGKSLVQRKLPSWIVRSEIIEEDIKSCSK